MRSSFDTWTIVSRKTCNSCILCLSQAMITIWFGCLYNFNAQFILFYLCICEIMSSFTTRKSCDKPPKSRLIFIRIRLLSSQWDFVCRQEGKVENIFRFSSCQSLVNETQIDVELTQIHMRDMWETIWDENIFSTLCWPFHRKNIRRCFYED